MAQILHERLIFQLLNPFILLPILVFLFFIHKYIPSNLTPKKNLPPSPPRLPIIGNLHLLGTLPFRSLQTLSQKHGDLMLLHLGSKPTIVISSAEIASEVLKVHDVTFAGRPKVNIFRRVLGNGKDMVSSPYGEYWRQMRSVCMLHLLSNKKVRSYRELREEEVGLMIKEIRGQKVVNLSDMLLSLSIDLTCRAAFGKKYRGEEVGFDFRKMLDGFMELLGNYYIGDFISWLGWINKINGVDAKVNSVTSTFDMFLERIMQDHSNRDRESDVDGEENEKDFVDVLLEVQRDETNEYPLVDRESIKGLILIWYQEPTVMANGTRLRTLEDNIRRAESQMVEIQQFVTVNKQFMESTQQFMEESRSRQDESTKLIEAQGQKTDRQYAELTDLLCSLLAKDLAPIAVNSPTAGSDRGILGAPPTSNPRDQAGLNPQGHQMREGGSSRKSFGSDWRTNIARAPKLDFPQFDGTNPRSWVRKAERYFAIFKIVEEQQDEIAAMYVNGRADVWLQGVLIQSPKLSWKELSRAACIRFDDKHGAEIVEEFNKLEQKGELDDYNEKFEYLCASMLAFDPLRT